MKKLYILFFITSLSFSQTNVGITGNVDGIYINEFHYDNDGGDVGEFVELAGPSGTDLSTYTFTLYNGNNSSTYDIINLTGTMPSNGFFVVPITGSIQNGSPDGFALSSTTTTDIQFLSYEGVISNATNGEAMGLTSVDIGVSEVSTTPIGSAIEYDEATTIWVLVADDTPGTEATLSIRNNEIERLTLFPNPSTEDFINVTTASNASINIVVYDVLGKQVKKQTIFNNRLNVSNLKSGIYLLRITQNNATSTKKLVIR